MASPNASSWTTSDVAKFLSTLQFSDPAVPSKLSEQEVDGQTLLSLTSEDLRSLGLNLRDQKLVLREVKKLGGAGSAHEIAVGRPVQAGMGMADVDPVEPDETVAEAHIEPTVGALTVSCLSCMWCCYPCWLAWAKSQSMIVTHRSVKLHAECCGCCYRVNQNISLSNVQEVELNQNCCTGDTHNMNIVTSGLSMSGNSLVGVSNAEQLREVIIQERDRERRRQRMM